MAEFILNVVVEGLGVESVVPEWVSRGTMLYGVIGWCKEGGVV